MALSSMTGFGQATTTTGGARFEVTIRGVNHRFLDISLRNGVLSPQLEQELCRVLKTQVSRGRVEISVSRSDASLSESSLKVNRTLLDHAGRELKQALNDLGLWSQELFVSLLSGLARREEIFELSREAVAADTDVDVLAAFNAALTDFVTMRRREGQSIERDFAERIQVLRTAADSIEAEFKVALELIPNRIAERVHKLVQVAPIEPQRLAQELAILADRLDISEELTRIRSHLSQLEKSIADGDSGKKIEFILQELGREFNTCGSKSQHTEISKYVIAGKAELEKLREQVQNVE